jgi:uncharacterized protein (TIGR00299 family) protein
VSRLAVFDCFSGIAGDMALAALIDAGASLESIRDGLSGLGLPPFSLDVEQVTRGGMRALHLRVGVDRERTYQPEEMRAMLRSASLPARARSRALAAIDALEAGERLAHASAEAHLHEAGGVDAMIDITGTMLALEALDVDEAVCPVVTVGAGSIVRAAHGALPASPGPAAAHILQSAGFALRFVEAAHELVTPTGAAILAAVARPGAATLTPAVHGAGAGSMDPPGRPNALRVFIGHRQAAENPTPRPAADAAGLSTRELLLLEANIDDMSPALLAHARDRLLEAGARDAWVESIGMKKGRSASKLCALVLHESEAEFAALFLRETSTIGVRATAYRRWEAARRIETFETSLGPVRFKVSSSGETTRAMPEYEDVAAIAARTGIPAIELQRRLEHEAASFPPASGPPR